MPRPDKITRVESLTELFKDARSVILNDFTGLDVEKMSELRRLCRESGVQYYVIKNTLAKRSIKDTQAQELEPYFEGPTAVALSQDDENVSAKVLAKFAQEHEAPKFKVGLVEGKVIDATAILALAKLPSRDELVSTIMAGIKSPANNLVFVLNGVIRNLVYVLDAIKNKKMESEGSGGTPRPASKL